MATAKPKVDKRAALKEQLKDEGFVGAAAAAVSNPEPGDPPSEIANPKVDWDFIRADESAFDFHFAKHGQEYDPKHYAYCWIPRPGSQAHDKYIMRGWQMLPVPYGDVVAARLPIDERNRRRALDLKRADERKEAPSRQFEQSAAAAKATGLFQTFDGDRSLRDGLD